MPVPFSCDVTPVPQAIGAIALLEHRDGSSLTINVEYNQLDPLLRATINKEGDVNDASGEEECTQLDPPAAPGHHQQGGGRQRCIR